MAEARIEMPMPGQPATSQVVLRGLTVATEPRALARPSRQAPPAKVAAVNVASNVLPFDVSQRAARDHDTAYQDAVQKGTKEGYADGYREGMKIAAEAAAVQIREAIDAAVAQAQQPLQERAKRMDELLGALAGSARDSVEAAQDDMTAFAFEALCRVLGDKAVTRESVTAQLHWVLENWRGREALTLHIHPDDARMLEEDALLAATLRGARAGEFQWQADPAVKLGGCIVHSASGGLDARLETQLASIKALLVQARSTADRPSRLQPAPKEART